VARADAARRTIAAAADGAELNELDEDTLYGGDGHGCTDDPTLDEVGAPS
jgi:hypothetical protein